MACTPTMLSTQCCRLPLLHAQPTRCPEGHFPKCGALFWLDIMHTTCPGTACAMQSLPRCRRACSAKPTCTTVAPCPRAGCCLHHISCCRVDVDYSEIKHAHLAKAVLEQAEADEAASNRSMPSSTLPLPQAHLEQAGVDELAGHVDATPQQVDTLPASAKPAPAAAAAPAPSANGDSAAPPAAAEASVKEKKRKHKEKTEGAAAASADVSAQSCAAVGCGLWAWPR